MFFRPKEMPEAYERRPYARLALEGLRNEVGTALRARAPTPEQKFLIFAQGRTGSTLLTSTLNRHPEIRCDDEILDRPKAFTRRYAENMARAAPTRCYGFHVKIYQLTAWQRVTDVGGFLREMQDHGWKLLYLWRENALRHVVSNVFAEASGAYHMPKDGGGGAPAKMPLPLDRLEKGIPNRLRLREEERAALNGLDYLDLNYERDLQSPESQPATFARIQDYLGVTQHDLTPKLKKMVDKPLSDLIGNYDEVAGWVAAHPEFASYLSA